MREKLLKRKLNPFLLVTTVLVLALLAGVSVMYQYQSNEVLTEKENLSAELTETKDTLEAARENVSILKTENKNLTSRVSDLETELENTREEKNNKISELETEVSDLENDKSDLQSQLEAQRQNASNMSERITELENINWNLRAELNTICDDDDNNLTHDSQEICEDY